MELAFWTVGTLLSDPAHTRWRGSSGDFSGASLETSTGTFYATSSQLPITV